MTTLMMYTSIVSFSSSVYMMFFVGACLSMLSPIVALQGHPHSG